MHQTDFTRHVTTLPVLCGGRDVDVRRRIRLSALLAHFQEGGFCQMRDFGFGGAHLNDTSLVWMLSSIACDVYVPPQLEDAIWCDTWSQPGSRVLTQRNFSFRKDDAAAPLVEGRSLWMLVDDKTHRAARLADHEAAMQAVYTPDEALRWPMLKRLNFREKDFSMVSSTPRMVYHSDTDMYGHMNNGRYVDWVLDAAETVWGNVTLRYFAIDFVQETTVGTMLFWATLPVQPTHGDCALAVQLTDEQGVVRARAVVEAE